MRAKKFTFNVTVKNIIYMAVVQAFKQLRHVALHIHRAPANRDVMETLKDLKHENLIHKQSTLL